MAHVYKPIFASVYQNQTDAGNEHERVCDIYIYRAFHNVPRDYKKFIIGKP